MNGMRMVVNDKGKYCIGGIALQSLGSLLLGEPSKKGVKKKTCNGCFQEFLVPREKSEEERKVQTPGK